MNAAVRSRGWLVIAMVVVATAPSSLQERRSALTPAEIEEALAIARSRPSDRATFHAPYCLAIDGPVFEYFRIERLEVITEFRRLELLGEQHARAGDTFGRGGIQHVQEALRPWANRVSVTAHLEFVPTTHYITGLPNLDLVLTRESVSVEPMDVKNRGIYSSSEPGASVLIGGVIEAVLDSTLVGQREWRAVVSWNGERLVEVPVDFARLR